MVLLIIISKAMLRCVDVGLRFLVGDLRGLLVGVLLGFLLVGRGDIVRGFSRCVDSRVDVIDVLETVLDVDPEKKIELELE